MTSDQTKQESEAIDLEGSPDPFEVPLLIKLLAAQLETEPFDRITAVTLQELSRMFERKHGIEVFKGTRSSFEQALSLVAEILVVKTLYERLGGSYVHQKELFSRLHFRALEITGELCGRWAEDLISTLDKLHAEYASATELPEE